MEEGKTENFRSALELLKMIDGALDGRDIKENAEEEEPGESRMADKEFRRLKRSTIILKIIAERIAKKQ